MSSEEILWKLLGKVSRNKNIEKLQNIHIQEDFWKIVSYRLILRNFWKMEKF